MQVKPKQTLSEYISYSFSNNDTNTLKKPLFTNYFNSKQDEKTVSNTPSNGDIPPEKYGYLAQNRGAGERFAEVATIVIKLGICSEAEVNELCAQCQKNLNMTFEIATQILEEKLQSKSGEELTLAKTMAKNSNSKANPFAIT